MHQIPLDQKEHTKMSDDERNYVNLKDFVATLPGGSADPAKVVSNCHFMSPPNNSKYLGRGF